MRRRELRDDTRLRKVDLTRVPDAPDHLLGKLVLGLVHSTWFDPIRVAASNIRDSFV
jgi:hypothetical protein